jgi:hypothetical protein
MATKRIVSADDVMGSGIVKYAGDPLWWSQASGQPSTAVEVAWKPNGDFESVSITFPDDAAARNFEYHMESYGICWIRE